MAIHVPPITTPRFELVSMSLWFMQRLLAGDRGAAEAEIGASVPVDLRDHLDDFLRFRIADLSVDPDAQPWLGRAVVLTEPDGRRQVIGTCGFHAPPGPEGRVEVGYSIQAEYRRQGVATEVVRALFDWAHANGVERFRASVSPDNVGSLAIVKGFVGLSGGTVRVENSPRGAGFVITLPLDAPAAQTVAGI